MISNISQYRAKFQDWKSKKSVLDEQIDFHQKQMGYLRDKIGISMETKSILVNVSVATQKRFLDYIESLVTVALQSVYGPDIKFIAKSEDSLECTLLVQEGDGEFYSPKDEMGSGVLDISSLALRVVMWSIQKPASRDFIWLDEPMKAIGKGPLLESSIAVLKNISDKLGIQFIINTHEPEIASLANRAFLVKKENGISTVEIISNDNGEGTVKKKSKLNRR
jgi:hypothetical protein